MKKQLVTAVILVLTMIFGLGWDAALKAEEIQWKAQPLFPPEDSGTVHAAGGMVAATNEALKGELTTTLYQVGQLVPEDQMFPALSRGVYDAAYMVPMIRSEAGSVAFGLPFGWENIDQVMEFYYDYGFLNFMRRVDAKRKVFYACPMPFGPVTLLSKFAVNTLDDFKGKKIWAEGPTAALTKALGGNPVWFDPGDVYMGLKLGTIDGVFWGLAELETVKIKEVVKYIMMPAPISPIVLDWVINLDSWSKLPDKAKVTYEKTMRDNVVKFYEKIMDSNNKGLAAAKAYGVKVITLSPEELSKFKAAAASVWDEIAEKDEASAKAVKMMRDYLNKKG